MSFERDSRKRRNTSPISMFVDQESARQDKKMKLCFGLLENRVDFVSSFLFVFDWKIQQ